MNINSQVYQHKPMNVPLPANSKKVKLVTALNLNASEFKNPVEKEKSPVIIAEPVVQKPVPTPSNEKIIDNKKKMSLKSTSVPFKLPIGPHEPNANANSNPIPGFLNQTQPNMPNAFQTTDGQSFVPLNFSELNSKSFPKLTNKKSLKSPIAVTNSSEDLKEKNEIPDFSEKETIDKGKVITYSQETKEAAKGVLTSIVEETHKIEDAKKNAQAFIKAKKKPEASVTKNEPLKENEQIKKKETAVETKNNKIGETKEDIKNEKKDTPEQNENKPSKATEKQLINNISSDVSFEETKVNLKKAEEKLPPIVSLEISMEETKVNLTKKEKPDEKPVPKEKIDVLPKTHYKELIMGLIQVFFFYYFQ